MTPGVLLYKPGVLLKSHLRQMGLCLPLLQDSLVESTNLKNLRNVKSDWIGSMVAILNDAATSTLELLSRIKVLMFIWVGSKLHPATI